MIEYVAAKAMKLVAGQALKELRALTSSAAMDAAVAKSEKQLLDHFFDRVSKLEAISVAGAAQREQFPLLFRRLFVEGVHAATAERRKMIADVLAGLVAHDHSAEVQSRIARAVMMLEPVDILVLKAKAWHFDSLTKEEGRTMRDMKDAQRDMSERALVSALCLFESAIDVMKTIRKAERTGSLFKQQPDFRLTSLGEEVLLYVVGERSRGPVTIEARPKK